jgi:hypothetical protein
LKGAYAQRRAYYILAGKEICSLPSAQAAGTPELAVYVFGCGHRPESDMLVNPISGIVFHDYL